MKEVEDKIQKIFSRAIARALGAMDIEGASPELKSAVKAAFWDSMEDVMEELEKELKNEGFRQ
jgi:hypothetical protein